MLRYRTIIVNDETGQGYKYYSSNGVHGPTEKTRLTGESKKPSLLLYMACIERTFIFLTCVLAPVVVVVNLSMSAVSIIMKQRILLCRLVKRRIKYSFSVTKENCSR